MADLLGTLTQKAASLFGAKTAPTNGAPPAEDEATKPKTPDPYSDHEAVLALVQKRRDEWGQKLCASLFFALVTAIYFFIAATSIFGGIRLAAAGAPP